MPSAQEGIKGEDMNATTREAMAIEADVEAAIAACGGDPRATIKALLVANAYLENQVEQLVGQASAGYIRAGRRKPRADRVSHARAGDD